MALLASLAIPVAEATCSTQPRPPQLQNFAACAVPSRHDLLIQDHAASDSGSKRYHDKITVALASALPHLSQGGHIGVISRLDGQAVQKTA